MFIKNCVFPAHTSALPYVLPRGLYYPEGDTVDESRFPRCLNSLVRLCFIHLSLFFSRFTHIECFWDKSYLDQLPSLLHVYCWLNKTVEKKKLQKLLRYMFPPLYWFISHQWCIPLTQLALDFVIAGIPHKHTRAVGLLGNLTSCIYLEQLNLCSRSSFPLPSILFIFLSFLYK